MPKAYFCCNSRAARDSARNFVEEMARNGIVLQKCKPVRPGNPCDAKLTFLNFSPDTENDLLFIATTKETNIDWEPFELLDLAKDVGIRCVEFRITPEISYGDEWKRMRNDKTVFLGSFDLKSLLDPEGNFWNGGFARLLDAFREETSATDPVIEIDYLDYSNTSDYLETTKLAISGDGVVITECFYHPKRLNSFVIPSEIKGRKVVAIGKNAFRHTAIESVRLPDSVTAIDDHAFADCPYLQDVNLPVGLKYLGVGTFQNCPSLKSASIPQSIDVIPESCFQYDSSLQNVSFKSKSEITIDNFAFYGCNKLFLVDFSMISKVKLGVGAFSNCSDLTEAIFKDDSEEIFVFDQGAFYNCSNLRKVKLPKKGRFGRAAFINCPNLKQLTMPANFVSDYLCKEDMEYRDFSEYRNLVLDPHIETKFF